MGISDPTASPINKQIRLDAEAQVVRPMDFNLMVSNDLYQGHTANTKDGLKNTLSNAGTNLTDDISNELASGATYTGFPPSPVAAQVVVAGADTGTVYYSYMATEADTDYTFGSIAVAGAGTYAISHNIWRCNFAYFVKNSATALNAGNITIQSQAGPGTNIFCRIDAGYGQSFCGAYTVPYNATVAFDRIWGDVRGGTAGAVEGFFWYRPYGESPRYRFPFVATFGSMYFDDVDYLIRVPSRTDFIPRVTYTSANNLGVKFSYRLVRAKQS